MMLLELGLILSRSQRLSAARTIMLIWHAEKPYRRHRGVDQNGDADSESLIPRGWQRAVALAQLFDRKSSQLEKPHLNLRRIADVD